MTDCDGFQAALAKSPDLAHLSRQARAHAGGCPACAALLADFEAIVEQAHHLLTPEPPDRWREIRGQLKKEGIIHSNGDAQPASLPHLVPSAPRSES